MTHHWQRDPSDKNIERCACGCTRVWHRSTTPRHYNKDGLRSIKVPPCTAMAPGIDPLPVD